MNSTGFDPANGSHWLLIGCFLTVSTWGLVLSWRWGAKARAIRQRNRQWNKRMRAERKQIEESRRLAMDLQRSQRSLSVLQLSKPSEQAAIYPELSVRSRSD